VVEVSIVRNINLGAIYTGASLLALEQLIIFISKKDPVMELVLIATFIIAAAIMVRKEKKEKNS
jgi:hypothetical protein